MINVVKVYDDIYFVYVYDNYGTFVRRASLVDFVQRLAGVDKIADVLDGSSFRKLERLSKLQLALFGIPLDTLKFDLI